MTALVKKTGLLLLALLLAGSFAASPLFSDEQDDKSLMVQAALIYKVTRFVIWPGQAFQTNESPIHICTAGKRGERLAEIIEEGTAGQRSQNRAIRTSFLKEFERDLGNYRCHILFLSGVTKARLAKLYKESDTAHTLVIADSVDLLEAGAMISVFVKNNRMALYINIDSLLAASKVKLQDALFSVGTVVQENSGKQGQPVWQQK